MNRYTDLVVMLAVAFGLGFVCTEGVEWAERRARAAAIAEERRWRELGARYVNANALGLAESIHRCGPGLGADARKNVRTILRTALRDRFEGKHLALEHSTDGAMDALRQLAAVIHADEDTDAA